MAVRNRSQFKPQPLKQGFRHAAELLAMLQAAGGLKRDPTYSWSGGDKGGKVFSIHYL